MRKRHIAITALLALVLAAATVWGGLMAGALFFGKKYYEDGSLARAARAYHLAANITPDFLGGWRGEFGTGTAQLKLGSLDAGVLSLRRALVRVPKDPDDAQEAAEQRENPEDLTDECRVRMNLAVGIELQGDRMREQGDPENAAVLFREASDMIEQCVPQGEDPNQQKQETDSKAQQSEQEAQGGGQQGQESPNSGNGNDDGGEGGDGGDGGDTPPDDGDTPPDGGEGEGTPQEQELRQRSKEAEELGRQEQNRDGDRSQWDGENW